MENQQAICKDLNQAVAVLRGGGLVAYPTDTVWGLGCDASNPEAVEKLYALKERPAGKAMLVLVADWEMLTGVVGTVPEPVMRLMNSSERPVTVIFPCAGGVASNLLGEDGSLGVRLTREPFSQELCRRIGAPIVSTSANFSGTPAPGRFEDIDSDLLDGLDYVAQTGRDLPPGKPSMIVKLMADGTLTVLRG